MWTHLVTQILLLFGLAGNPATAPPGDYRPGIDPHGWGAGIDPNGLRAGIDPNGLCELEACTDYRPGIDPYGLRAGIEPKR